ncbi:MFS transporter, partial [Ralstonia pseudosolanacearum]
MNAPRKNTDRAEAALLRNASTTHKPANPCWIPNAAAAGLNPGPRWRARFWAIFGGQALSLIGSALTQFVLLWWITDTTGSVSALATAGLAALLPQAVLSPLGGTFADRY